MLRRRDSKPASMQVFIAHQLNLQRQNLYSVCRLAVKSMIDRSSYGSIEDHCMELENLLIIIEQILSHRIKPLNTWYGALEPRCFWDFIQVACRRLPNNCIDNIEALEWPKTAHGKGRAWLRMCLMEKRLSDYIAFAVQQTKLIMSFYDDGSLMLSDESNLLAELFLGLNSIDFSFDIKGTYLDYQAIPIIDFTPYLKFNIMTESGYPQISDGDGSEPNSTECEKWKMRYEKLDEQLKRVNEQKSYVEERLRLRERQLEEAEESKQRLIHAQRSVEAQTVKDQMQFEAVVIELQSQLSQLKEENRRYVLAIQELSLQQQGEQSGPPISSRYKNQSSILTMSELIELDRLHILDEGLGEQQSSIEVEDNSTTGPNNLSAGKRSGHSTDDRNTAYSDVNMEETDCVSNIALAGSFTSLADTSINPLSAHRLLGQQQQHQGYVKQQESQKELHAEQFESSPQNLQDQTIHQQWDKSEQSEQLTVVEQRQQELQHSQDRKQQLQQDLHEQTQQQEMQNPKVEQKKQQLGLKQENDNKYQELLKQLKSEQQVNEQPVQPNHGQDNEQCKEQLHNEQQEPKNQEESNIDQPEQRDNEQPEVDKDKPEPRVENELGVVQSNASEADSEAEDEQELIVEKQEGEVSLFDELQQQQHELDE